MQDHSSARAGHAIMLGSLLGGLAVVLGAFAAHAMKERFDAAALKTFETGVRYQMFHALALILCGVLESNGYRTRWASRLFLLGTMLFSGSLYGLVWTEARWLGPVTPLGGVAFVAGWAALAIAARNRAGTCPTVDG